MSQFTRDVHRLIAGLPPASAAIVAGMIAAEAAPPSDELAKAYLDWASTRAEDAQRGAVRQFISKRAAGEETDSIAELIVTISKIKAGFQGPGGEQKWDRNKHWKDPSTGRFVHMSHRMEYREDTKPIDHAKAEKRLGIVQPQDQPGHDASVGMDDQKTKYYQQAYLQLARSLERYRGWPQGLARVHLQYDDGKRDDFDPNDPQYQDSVKLTPEKKLRGFEVHVTPPSKTQRNQGLLTFDAVQAITGNPEFAAHLAGRNLRADATKFGNDIRGREGEEYVPGTANFRRLQAGADLLTAVAGPVMSPAGLAATTTASYVGQFGPEAQKVFGPAVDRAKYRYKGTERKIDPDLKRRFKEIKDSVKGLPAKEQPEAARQILVYGDIDPTTLGRRQHAPTGNLAGRGQVTGTRMPRPGDNDDHAPETVNVFHPSPVIDYMKDLLPSPKLAALQRMSGHIPPSQGLIVDDKGQVSTQMIGHGDDWYLPFDLKNLGALRGGEYIRTRMNGGLTTEDLYTGLMSGARSMTAVSHNGVYTLEFDDTFRGTRRYNSTAREMTRRYGQLLDAVKSGQVPANELDQSIVDQIYDEAAQEWDPVSHPDDFRRVVGEKMQRAHKAPEPSDQMKKEWTAQFIEQQRMKTKTKDGRPLAHQAYLRQFVILPLAQQLADSENAELYDIDDPEGSPQVFDRKDFEEDALRTFEQNPLATTRAALNHDGSWDRFFGTKMRELRASSQPMQLDGPGYNFAAQALKEQFPYFIKDVRWTPWDEKAPDAGTDHGYVKPRFVRPEGALAGYFDQSVLGHTKRSADRVRFQNFDVMNRMGLSHEGNPHGPSGSTSERVRWSNERPKTTDGSTPERSGEITPDGKQRRDAEPAKLEAGRQADLAFIKAMLEATRYGKSMDAVGQIDGRHPGGQNVGEDRQGWMQKPEGYKLSEDFKLLAKPYRHFEAMDDAELHRHANLLYDLQSRHDLFDLPARVIYGYETGGERPPAQTLTDDDLIDAGVEDNHEKEWNIGKEFEPGRTKPEYRATFEQNKGIGFVAARAGLDDLDDPEFSAKLASYQLELGDALREQGLSAYDRETYRRIARDAVKLRQLHRRYHESGGGVVGGAGGAGPVPGGGNRPYMPPGGRPLPSNRTGGGATMGPAQWKTGTIADFGL